MSFNGSGTFNVYTPGNPVVTGTTISSTAYNNTNTDFATGLSNTLTRDGQSPATANIPMGSNKITGLANGTARTDAAPLGQVQDGGSIYLTGVAGVDTITASLAPAITAYAAGQTFRFVSAGANTGAATLNINGLGAKSVTKNGATALAAGDIASGAAIQVTYDGTQFQLVGVAASVSVIPSAATGTTQAQYDNSTKLATTAYADRAASSRVFSISASVASNAITVSASNLSLDFRSTTLTAGTVTTVQGTPANLVIAATDSFAAVTAAGTQRIAILAINNAGTIELAASNLVGGVSLDETGVITTATTATTATAIKAAAVRTGVAYRVVGFVDVPFTTAVGYGAIVTVQGQGGQALAAMSSLGYGQTWQDVTGSRAVNTTYYNTTGKPITVAINVSSGTSASGSIVVNSQNVITGTANWWSVLPSITFIVPAGASYGTSTTNVAIGSWRELR